MRLFLRAPAPVPDGIAPKFFNQVSQIAHSHFMGFYGLIGAIFWGWKGLVAWALMDAAYAAWHEFYYDPRNENSATRGSDVEDFCFLLLGSAMAWAVWAVAHHFGRLR